MHFLLQPHRSKGIAACWSCATSQTLAKCHFAFATKPFNCFGIENKHKINLSSTNHKASTQTSDTNGSRRGPGVVGKAAHDEATAAAGTDHKAAFDDGDHCHASRLVEDRLWNVVLLAPGVGDVLPQRSELFQNARHSVCFLMQVIL